MHQDYEYLITIHELGSIKAAAEQLHVTQPAVSIALKRVEDALRVHIFDRRTRPLQPTKEGRVVLRYLRQIKDMENLMEMELRDMEQSEAGKITIATTHYMMRFLIPPLLATYHERYPNVVIKLIDESGLRINDLFLQGGIDVLISPIRLEMKNIVCRDICQDKFLFCIPNQYLPEEAVVHYTGQTYGEYLANFKPAFFDINLLRDIPLITLEEGSSAYNHMQRIFKDARIVPYIYQTVDQISTLNALANSGLGAALTSVSLVWYTAVSHKVSFFHYDSPHMCRTYYLMYDRNRYLSTAAKNFLGVCQEYSAGKLTGWAYMT